MSRSILDIAIAVDECRPVTEAELRLAVAALSHMQQTTERSLRELAEALLAGQASAKLRAHCVRRDGAARFQARKRPPADYLGPEHTPGTPENRRLRAVAKNLFRRATGQEL